MDVIIRNTPSIYLRDAVTISVQFRVEFPDKIGRRNGVGYTVTDTSGRVSFYAYQTEAGTIVVDGRGVNRQKPKLQ